MSKQFDLEVVVCVLLGSNSYLELQLCQEAGPEEGQYIPSLCFPLRGEERADVAAIREAREQLGVEVRPDDIRCFHVRQENARRRMLLFFRVTNYAKLPGAGERGRLDSLQAFYLHKLPENIAPYLSDVLYCWQRNVIYSSSIGV